MQAPAQRENGIYSAKLVRDAVKAIETCPFNYGALGDHLAALRQKIDDAPTEEKREHARLVHQNDKCCADRIRAGCHFDRSGMARYTPEYRTSYTGRIIEVGGGAQSCSRAMKAALFDGIPDLRNYDLKRAQAFIVLQELEDAGLPRSWVQGYVHNPTANDAYGSAVGIRADAFKRCVYATIMGARHQELYDRKKNEVFDALCDEADGDEVRGKALTLAVYGALAPLKVEVDAWHDHLMTAPKCRHVDPNWASVRTLKNACKQRFPLKDERVDVLARRAAAFILQGQEAAFIHTLTALGKTNDFAPISNQHDGLVVLGTIPQSAVAKAAGDARLRYATLNVKPFV